LRMELAKGWRKRVGVPGGELEGVEEAGGDGNVVVG